MLIANNGFFLSLRLSLLWLNYVYYNNVKDWLQTITKGCAVCVAFYNLITMDTNTPFPRFLFRFLWDCCHLFYFIFKYSVQILVHYVNNVSLASTREIGVFLETTPTAAILFYYWRFVDSTMILVFNCVQYFYRYMG